MANRSHLYTIDFDPTERAKTDADKILSIGEWAFSIPLAAKILVSSGTKVCKSCIWEYEHPIAIVGEFETGKSNLYSFWGELMKHALYLPEEIKLGIEEARIFLQRNDRKQKYFLFECGEIFEMEDYPIEEQNLYLYENILQINKSIQECYNSIDQLNQQIEFKTGIVEKRSNQSFFQKLFSNTPKVKKEEFLELARLLKEEYYSATGAGGWSDTLYYQFE